MRLSRGVGLPDPVPDVHGIAVKLLDACGTGCDQDLLLASAGSSALARHLLRPARTFGGGIHSSILPYRTADGGRSVFAARFRPPADVELGNLDDVVGAGGATIELLASEPGTPWRAIGEVGLRPGRLSDDEAGALSFDPWHTALDLVPAGLLNDLRRPAYNASRQGRPDGFDHQPEPGKP